MVHQGAEFPQVPYPWFIVYWYHRGLKVAWWFSGACRRSMLPGVDSWTKQSDSGTVSSIILSFYRAGAFVKLTLYTVIPMLNVKVRGGGGEVTIPDRLYSYCWRIPVIGQSPVVTYLLAQLIYLNFHPLEVVCRYRDPQLKITHICLIWAKILANLDVHTHISFPIKVIWSTKKTD